MGFHLDGSDGQHVKVNVWHWLPTLELLRRHQLLPPDTLELASFNASGGAEVSAIEAKRIADFLDGYLTVLQANERIYLDGSVTNELDTGELFRDDRGKNYSVTYHWLIEFRDFCRTSNGFVIT